MHRAWLALLLLTVGLPALAKRPPAPKAKPAPAAAADTGSAEALIKEGERLYQTGRYHDAAETLIRAQQLQPNPRLVYNIARAFDQAGELDRALESYQQYVGSSEGTDPVLLKRSALAIERLRGLVQQQQGQRQKEEAERARLAAEKQRAEEATRAEAAAKERARAESEERQRALELSQQESAGKSRTAAYVVGGIGAAAVANGAVFGVLALVSKNDFTAAPDAAGKMATSSTVATRALIADVSFAAGVAALVTAVVLYPKAPAARPQATLLVTPTRSGVQASVEVPW